MLLKLLGLVDIFSALIIFFNVYNIHWIITWSHSLILLAKGVPSLFYDPLSIAYGLTDVVAALFIIFAVAGLLPVKIVIMIVLVGKGVFSLL